MGGSAGGQGVIPASGRFLRRWPALHRLASKVYLALGFDHLMVVMMGTRAKERRWAKRTIGKGYWDNRELPGKHFLVERLSALAPFRRVLEVGCASGPNLYLLAKKFPGVDIVGVDINRQAVEYGNEQFAREGLANVKLLVGKADKLAFADKAFDVTFSWALLMYIGPDKVEKVIQQMLRVSRRALVLLEAHSFEPGKGGKGFYFGDYWVRDYRALLRQFVPDEQIHISKIPEYVKWDGAVIEVRLTA